MQKKLHRFLFALLAAALIWASLPARPAYAAGYTVNSLADTVAADGFCTLREAIEAANNTAASECGPASSADDTITFASSLSGTITLGSTLPTIVAGEGALTIDGGGVITISGNSAVRVFFVNPGADLTLLNLTIANGKVGGHGNGGGVYNAGTMTAKNVTFSDNQAEKGGGMYNANGSSAMLTNVTFNHNIAFIALMGCPMGGVASAIGGGMYNIHSSPTLINVTFQNNAVTYTCTPGIIYAQTTRGGGMYNENSSPTLTNVTFGGNSATQGSGIYNQNSNPAIRNTIIWNKIYNVSGSNPTISYSDIQGCNGSGGGWNASCGTDGGGNIDVNPLFISSPTNLRLQPTSPAIDAGNNAFVPAGVTTDLDGNPRFGDIPTVPDTGVGTPPIVDMGAYETHETIPPVVTSTSLATSYVNTGPDSFTVTFSEDVQDPPDHTNTDDATNPANYLLIEIGPNNAVDTASCLGGLAGDDTQVTVTGVSYNSTTFTSTVTLASALGSGSYRLFVCGTTSIVDSSGNPLNSGTDYTFDFVVTASVSTLPATGFPIGRQTLLPAQPLNKAYASYDNLILEIPALGVKAPIIGVLKSGESWDVTWLGNSVGWLEGSAFPTWSGNTVLTGHVWNADNTPGIFASLKSLKYGDRFYIHAFDQTYVYEVRENARLWGNGRVSKVFKHEEYDWVTLLTCEGYNPLTGDYFFRRLVRAVLVQVK